MGRGGLTQFCINFLRYRTGHFRSEKIYIQKWVRLPRPRQPRHRRPTALKLGSEDSQLGGAYALQVWWRPVSREARNRGSGEVLCAKSTFFPLMLNRTREARALCGFQRHKGITCFVLFSGTTIVGLATVTPILISLLHNSSIFYTIRLKTALNIPKQEVHTCPISSTIYSPEGAYPEASGGYELGEKLSSSARDRILGSRGCRAVSEAPEGGRP